MKNVQARNMRLLAHDTLGGHGKMGEGMSIQLARDGRRILWLAHESAPKNFTGVDVTDPGKPKVVVQTELPHDKVRSNSLEVVGDAMAVAYQVATPGLQPAGIELFDVSTPERPRPIGFFDASGPRSRGVHQLWFVDQGYLTCAAGAADFQPRNQLDDQIFRIIDLSIRRARARPAAGGFPAPARATTHRRRRAIRASTAAGAPTTPTSIRSARSAPTWPTWTAAS